MEVRHRPDWLVYARSLLLVGLVLFCAVLVQIAFIYKEFHLRFVIVPTAVTLIVGLLLGRVTVLRQRLRQKTLEFRAIVDIAQEFTYLRRIDGQYEYVSPSCLSFTGYSQQNFLDHPNLMDSLIHPDDRERWRCHIHHINDRGDPESFDVRLITKDGETRWFTHICAPVYDETSRQIGVRSTNVDITQRKADQAHIERMAHYDPLTDLPNRRLLEQELARRTQQPQPFAVLFLDLSRFKNVNDSLGHSFGDQLLQRIAQRLQTTCPPDTLLCRFGGDEFVIVLPQNGSRTEVVEFARRMLGEIERPLIIDSSELRISGTVGVACYPEDGGDSVTLIRNADAAMYRAKRQGQDKIAVYHADYSREASHFISIESDLHRALQEGEFLPYYQPKVDLRSGRIVALEALARWQHPIHGLVPPGQFIPVAEETGQITELGKQMLEHVLADLGRWRLLGCAVPIAVNVSPRQFTDREFWQLLHDGVESGGFDPALLELEITEQVFLGDIDAAASRLHELRTAGFHIALDDFGNGYSSFNYLRRLPVDSLKLDRAFITDVVQDPVSRAILRATVGLCDELGLTLIAEGVETEAQRAVLISHHCRQAQGYLFHRPLAATDLEALLPAGSPLPGTRDF
ncbi:putative bifunctional diguanylate cyclase/phosphodiesterase [Sulfurivermis fontis]|uniref:putative bifunctional diguanylate cyclase/phosphodiesterase n=1 Tax=Sulfurivermis fontis TaxID=1972068 RepID=UPI000FDC5A08|nr:GGDEF domain-containing phosphodiesterase [Sulfurivermis fontis]